MVPPSLESRPRPWEFATVLEAGVAYTVYNGNIYGNPSRMTSILFTLYFDWLDLNVCVAWPEGVRSNEQ